MDLHYDQSPCDTVETAVSLYGKREFQSPTRSTVPLLSWLKHEQAAVRSLFQQLGMPANCSMHLEYTVDPPQGRGMASHTDLMVISAPCALAIEAKWTEPRYDTVGKWLTKGENRDNRQAVVTGWLGLLKEHASSELQVEDLKKKDVVYQMVHRAASACKAGTRPKLAYLVFKLSSDPKSTSAQAIKKDLAFLWQQLGSPAGFPFYLIEVKMSLTDSFDKIKELGKRDAGTPGKVKEALLQTRLFDFSEPELSTVSD